MGKKKYINTNDVVRLTGLSKNKIYEMIHDGELPAHKAPKSGWRVSLEDLSELGLIQDVTPAFVEEPEEELYEELFDEPIEDNENEEGFYYVADKDQITTEEIVSHFGFNPTTAKRYLCQLAEFGYLEAHGGNKNRTYSKK